MDGWVMDEADLENLSGKPIIGVGSDCLIPLFSVEECVTLFGAVFGTAADEVWAVVGANQALGGRGEWDGFFDSAG
ncbi:MAG: hypothetical protein ACTSP1_11095 [Candidatus Freyarchaeota archaeon]